MGALSGAPFAIQHIRARCSVGRQLEIVLCPGREQMPPRNTIPYGAPRTHFETHLSHTFLSRQTQEKEVRPSSRKEEESRVIEEGLGVLYCKRKEGK